MKAMSKRPQLRCASMSSSVSSAGPSRSGDACMAPMPFRGRRDRLVNDWRRGGATHGDFTGFRVARRPKWLSPMPRLPGARRSAARSPRSYLERACLETVKARWFARLRDPLVKGSRSRASPRPIIGCRRTDR